MMKSAEDRLCDHLAAALDRPMGRRILAEGKVRPDLVVIHGVGGQGPAQTSLAEDDDLMFGLRCPCTLFDLVIGGAS